MNYTDDDGDGEIDLIPTLMETDKGIYTVDGAEVVTRAYNYLNTDELVDEINRQLIQKQNMVMEDSSFGLGIPLFGSGGKMGRRTMSGLFPQQ